MTHPFKPDLEGPLPVHPADPVGTSNIETTRWEIDPARSSVEFRTKSFYGLPTVKGCFSRYQGTHQEREAGHASALARLLWR